MNKLKDELEEKEKIIAFLKKKYEEETGRVVNLPMNTDALFEG